MAVLYATLWTGASDGDFDTNGNWSSNSPTSGNWAALDSSVSITGDLDQGAHTFGDIFIGPGMTGNVSASGSGSLDLDCTELRLNPGGTYYSFSTDANWDRLIVEGCISGSTINVGSGGGSETISDVLLTGGLGTLNLVGGGVGSLGATRIVVAKGAENLTINSTLAGTTAQIISAAGTYSLQHGVTDLFVVSNGTVVVEGSSAATANVTIAGNGRVIYKANDDIARLKVFGERGIFDGTQLISSGDVTIASMEAYGGATVNLDSPQGNWTVTDIAYIDRKANYIPQSR